MPSRNLDREILELGHNGQSHPHIPQDVALDYFLAMRKIANEMAQVPEVGTESPEAVIMRDQALSLAQAQAELQNASAQAEELKAQLMQAEQVATEAQASEQQVTEQAGQAMEAANSATANAAAQADAKMRLSMRINEMRQQLADIVSTDPVAEEGLGTGEVAGPGAPQTAEQQAQAAQEEEMMAQEEAAQSAPPSAKATKEVTQAQRAQQEAAKQTAQAEQAVGKTAADKGSKSSKPAKSLYSRWGELYSKPYVAKTVGAPATAGTLGGGALGGFVGKMLSKSRKGAAIGAVIGAIGGGTSGGGVGAKKVKRERKSYAVPILTAGVNNLKRHKGVSPLAASYNTRTGRMRALVRTKDGYKTYVADPPKTASEAEKLAYKTKGGKVIKHPVSEKQRRWAFAAEAQGNLPEGTARKWSKRAKGKDLPIRKNAADESGGSDRIRFYLERTAGVDARLRNLIEAAYSTDKPIQPTGPGGMVEKVESKVNGDLVADAPNQDTPTCEKVAVSNEWIANMLTSARLRKGVPPGGKRVIDGMYLGRLNRATASSEPGARKNIVRNSISQIRGIKKTSSDETEKVATPSQFTENRILEALRESPRGQRMKSLAAIVSDASQKAGRAIE